MVRMCLRLAVLLGICASVTSVAVEKRHRHSVHNRHHRLRGGSRSNHRKRRIHTDNAANVEEAINNLPAKLGESFTAFQQDGSATNAAETLEQLNAVYRGALNASDTVALDCKGKTAHLAGEVKSARDALALTQARLTQVQDRMQSLQAGVDHSLAEIQTVRAHFEQHRATCDKNRQEHAELIANLTADLPLAESLASQATSSCAGGGNPPGIVECTMPDGTIVVTFSDQTLRVEASKMSGPSEMLLEEALDAAVRRQIQASSLLSVGISTERRHTTLHTKVRKRLRLLHKRSRRHTHRHARHHRMADIPIHLCTATTAPTCSGFADAIFSFVGGVKDSIAQQDMQGDEAAQHCTKSLDSYSAVQAQLKQEVDDAQISLANTVAEQGSLSSLERERRTQLADLTNEHDLGEGECTKQLAHIADTIRGTKTLWAQLSSSSSGTFSGDCVVGDWVPGQCSQPCGSGGVQKFTREIITSPGDNSECPPLAMSRPCNDQPCPVDGIMGRWEDWSGCSRPCGGGTRTRRRAIIREAQNGGIPTAETVQEELCNQNPCDQDCVLSDWNEWSSCSKACMTGHQTRVKHVVHAPLGEGTCLDETDRCRRQYKLCNEMLCNETFSGKASLPKCSSAIDLVFVLDGSGSVSSGGFEDAKTMLTNVLGRTQLMGETLSGDLFGPEGKITETSELALGARIGVVAFGSKAEVVQDLSNVRTTISQAVTAVQWPGSQVSVSATNTASALAVAREMFDHHTSRGNSPRAVIVVTDGPPMEPSLVASEIDRLNGAGIRVSFVSVGWLLKKRDLESWASWPAIETVKQVDKHEALREEQTATDVIASQCPLLSFA